MNIGIQVGPEPFAAVFDLPREAIVTLQRLGASVAVTVYAR